MSLPLRVDRRTEWGQGESRKLGKKFFWGKESGIGQF
ncbi:MAG: hypothetical protein ACI9AF_000703 [Granulosicoccus sp.]